MLRTKFALAFYYLAIGFLTACSVTIVVKLIFWPPCTQTGNTCAVDPWSAAGLEGGILGVSATVLAILGAVAVAGWWTYLNERVTNQVTILYNAQKKDIDRLLGEQQQLLETNTNHSQSQIDDLTQFKNDIEEILVESFAAMSPLFSETAATKAISMGRLLRFPYAMAMTYFQLLELEVPKEQEGVKDEINFFNQTKTHIHLDTNIKVTLEAQRNILGSIERRIDNQRLMLASDTRKYWERVNYWINIIITSQENTPDSTNKDLNDLVDKRDAYIPQMKKMEEDLLELRDNVHKMIITIETQLHQMDNQRTP